MTKENMPIQSLLNPEKVAVFTFVKDYHEMARHCKRSFHYFHPLIPFRVYEWDECMQICKEENTTIEYLFAHVGRRLHREGYDHVVHLDGDIIVTGPLTQLLESPAEITGTRAQPDQGSGENEFLRANVLTGDPIAVLEELNAGVFGVRNPKVWDDWIASNRRYGPQMPLREQDTLNDLFWSGKYRTSLLDPPEVNEYWNTATKWGGDCGIGGVDGFLDSWKKLFCREDTLWLASAASGIEKRVRLLHMAGGSWPSKELGFDHPEIRSKFAPEVWEFIEKVRADPEES